MKANLGVFARLLASVNLHLYITRKPSEEAPKLKLALILHGTPSFCSGDARETWRE